jgi:L-ascorbate metabolism protein UlaG (beta-lactamase superfamily)
MMVFLLLIFALIILVIVIYMQQPMFGSLPKGKRLKKIQQSPNYREGSFQNIHHTPQLTEGSSYLKVISEFLFRRTPGKKPSRPIPSVSTDLHQLDTSSNTLIWFGHSSYFLQVDGKRFLVDPVLSGSASPMPGGTKAFEGSDIFHAADIPDFDYLLITHDHWDHLDYRTIKALQPKIKAVICPLGVGAHFERWGFDNSLLTEKDWYDSIELADGFTLTLQPGRHFSGRTLKRNTSLWTSYILKTVSFNIFLGGDSGYDTHFKIIGDQYGPFDLAILENGQYDKSWRYIHLLPTEILQAAADLKAKTVLPVHSSKFMLGNHAWDEPLSLIAKNSIGGEIRVITPMIGEKVELDDQNQAFTRWWETNATN